MSTIIEDPALPLVEKNNTPTYYSSEKRRIIHSKKYDNVGYRLAKRKQLFKKRKIICDFALGAAIIGIMLMVAETELYMAEIYEKTDTTSFLIKSFISLSTFALIGFIIWYHVLDIKLFMCDNCLDDWHLALSNKKIICIAVEVIIYSIHPVPGLNDIDWKTFSYEENRVKTIRVPIDVLLSFPMFLRLNLLCRVIMLHSRIFNHASSQSLGALNRIHFNFKFIFKSMMTLYPGYVLAILMLGGLVITSWLLRACEMYHTEVHLNFLNAMWVISITFLTVGYGDIVPQSYCGRSVAVVTGIFGAGCTALIVAVLAQNLELARAEKYVHNFVLDIELDKQFKHAAANILKAGWMIYKCKTLKRPINKRKHERKLLKAIHEMREVKQNQRKLNDNSINLVEMFKCQTHLYNKIEDIDAKHTSIELHIDEINQKLTEIDKKMEQLCSLLHKFH